MHPVICGWIWQPHSRLTDPHAGATDDEALVPQSSAAVEEIPVRLQGYAAHRWRIIGTRINSRNGG
jgi:hypothetical protein